MFVPSLFRILAEAKRSASGQLRWFLRLIEPRLQIHRLSRKNRYVKKVSRHTGKQSNTGVESVENRSGRPTPIR